MKLLASILILVLASCATTPPRAILPPKTDVPPIRTQDVEDSSAATDKAVREIVKAGEETRRANDKVRTTTEKLQDSINRAEIIAEAHKELQVGFFEIQKFSKQLSDDLSEMSKALDLAQDRENRAVEVVGELTEDVAKLKAQKAAQDAFLKVSDAENANLRATILELSEVPAKLTIAEDKLDWWRWRFAPLSIFTVLALAALLYFKPF